MPHPFEVGKSYRNRAGEYVVVSIDDDQMKIRYVSGAKTLVTDVTMQTRIWENIQFEEQMSRAEERRRLAQEARLVARARIKHARAKPVFGGFQDGDFEFKKRGVAWLSRKELGKALAYELSQRAAKPFLCWPVPRRAAVHIAQKDRYDTKTLDRNAAFFVAVNEPGVSFGLYVGKPEGKAEATWPWSLLLAALAAGTKVREALWTALEKQQLSLDVYAMQVSFGMVGQVTIQDSRLLWQQETAQQGVTRPVDWAELVDILTALTAGSPGGTPGAEKRCELYVCKHVSKEESVKPDGDLIGAMETVFHALLPVYEAILRA